MKRILVFIIQLFLIFTSLFAKQDIDDVISSASIEIVESCNVTSILALDDFESPYEEMTLYIREHLSDSILSEDGLMQIITREDMTKIENASEKEILSIAKKMEAKAIIFGKIEELNNSYSLKIRMLDVNTGTYIFRKNYEFAKSTKTEQLLRKQTFYYKLGLGIGEELNKNSLEGVSLAASISFDYNISRKFSVGIKMFVSYDLNEKANNLMFFEPLAFLRFYLFSPSREPGTGLFLEGLTGSSILVINSNTKSVVNGGTGIGYRFAFEKLYVEPELRFGYPYLFGVGINAGIRF